MSTDAGRWRIDAPEYVPSWLAPAAQSAPGGRPVSPAPVPPPAPPQPPTPPPAPPAPPESDDDRPPAGGPGWRFRLGCQFGGDFAAGISPAGARALADFPAELRVALSLAVGTPRWRAALAAAGGPAALSTLLGGELPHLLHAAVGLGDGPAARAAAAAIIAGARGDPAAVRAAVLAPACGACRATHFGGGSWLAHWLVFGRASPAVLTALWRLRDICWS